MKLKFLLLATAFSLNSLAMADCMFLKTTTDYKQVAKKFEQACNSSDAKGCTELGALYQCGRGVKQDKPHAAKLFEQACNGGDAMGCFRLGSLYESGEGVKQDKTQAAQLFKKACDAGNSLGCNVKGVKKRKTKSHRAKARNTQ